MLRSLRIHAQWVSRTIPTDFPCCPVTLDKGCEVTHDYGVLRIRDDPLGAVDTSEPRRCRNTHGDKTVRFLSHLLPFSFHSLHEESRNAP